MRRLPATLSAMNKRKYLNAAEKATVLSRQNNRCACCNEPIDLNIVRPEYDHEIPLQFGGSNHLSNFRALLPKHHLTKTREEAAKRAKTDRQHKKFFGLRQNASDRDAARIVARTKQLQP